ncbi:MAG: acetoacetate decarboxylase family protein, partial [Candidatus Competibacterales bacterium]|nr:acetoacetate decarboxylase family protein [Candidatus Competibacterales bacterium]
RILFAFSYLSEIEWLDGRGYNTLGVYVPACYSGSEREYPGELNLVLWENMADPIITGREELGIAKVYCELPPPRVQESTATCTASWDGHGFAGLELTDLADASPEPAVLLEDSAGLLHHKYIPCTGEWGKADVSYPVLTPAAAPNSRVIWRKTGMGSCRFVESTWEQLPTLVHIVNALAAIELGRCLFAEMFEVRGYKDISDQHRLT